VYRINDDTEFRTLWAAAFVMQLASFQPVFFSIFFSFFLLKHTEFRTLWAVAFAMQLASFQPVLSSFFVFPHFLKTRNFCTLWAVAFAMQFDRRISVKMKHSFVREMSNIV